MRTKLTGNHKTTYETIFRHPVPHNLDWRSLTAMFAQLGDLVEEPNGKMRFTRNGHTLVMHAQAKDLEADEVMNIRRFLDASKDAEPDEEDMGRDFVVVLDHSGARLFHRSGSVSEPVHVEPHDPKGHDRQVHQSKGGDDRHGGPHRKQFYEAVAEKLAGARQILMVGDGHGSGSEITHFLAEMESNHVSVAIHVIGQEVMDLHHLTNRELLAKARKRFVEIATERIDRE